MKLLEDYRVRLAEARKEADDPRERAQRTARSSAASCVAQADAQRERILTDEEAQHRGAGPDRGQRACAGRTTWPSWPSSPPRR